MTNKEQIKELEYFAELNIDYTVLDGNEEYATEVNIDYKGFAEALYNAGYRKIPENAVVLTREEQDYIQSITEKRIKELKKQITQARKETAEKFSDEIDKWKEKAIFYYNLVKESGIYCVVDDEICKGITEKEVQNGN